MKDEDLEIIFNRFTRIDDSAHAIQGCGIGLALVKELVESHGGSIKVKSELNVGSEFTVTLPVVPIDKIPKGRSLENPFSDKEILVAQQVNTDVLRNSIEEFRKEKIKNAPA